MIRAARKKLGEMEKTRSIQLELFDGVFSDEEARYTQSIALYDVMPKYVWERTPREGGRFLPVKVRNFKHEGMEYTLEIRPARLIDPDGVDRDYYPAEREQIVEEVIRKKAIERRRTMLIDDHSGVVFPLNEIRRELAEIGHTYSLAEIKDAILISNGCGLTLKSADNAVLVAAPIYPIIGLNERQGKGKCVSFVTFNPLVTEAIKKLDFRQLNYTLSVSFKRNGARWLHKRLSHRYSYASAGYTYDISATTIMRDSGMGEYKRLRDAFRSIQRDLDELVSMRVIRDYRDKMKPVYGGNKSIVDIEFSLEPTTDFVKEQKQANWRGSLVKERYRKATAARDEATSEQRKMRLR